MVSEINKPSDETMQLLIDLKVALKTFDSYIFSPEFIETSHYVVKNPPGFWASYKLSRKLMPMKDIFAPYLQKMQIQRVGTLGAAYLMLLYHIERLNLSVDKSQLPTLALAVTWMNDEEDK